MALHMIEGVLGAGKGRHMVRLCRKTLRETDLPIVGNFAWEIEPWAAGNGKLMCGWEAGFRYRANEPEMAKQVRHRIFRIPDEWVPEFFLYRAIPNDKVSQIKTSEIIKAGEKFTLCKAAATYSVRVDKDTGLEEKRLVRFDTELFALGAQCYHIDEAWKFWNAREWTSTSKAFVYYAAHSRKTGDECWIATQAIKDIDASIVRKMQDFHCMVNLSKRHYGMFRQPDKIIAKVYSKPPTGNLDTDTKQRTIEYPASPEWVDECYDTTGGVGLAGRMVGDLNEKKTGLNWKWLYAAAAMVPILVFAFFFSLSVYLKHMHHATVDKLPSSRAQVFQSDTNTLNHAIVQSFIDAGQKFGQGAYGHSSVDTQVDNSTLAPTGFEELVCGYYFEHAVPHVLTTTGEEYVGNEIRGITAHEVSLMDGRVLKWYRPKNSEIGSSVPLDNRVDPLQPLVQTDRPRPLSSVQVTPAIGGQGSWDPSFRRQFPDQNQVSYP